MGVSTPGVIGSGGRYTLHPTRPRAADLTLAGAPLPLTGAARIYTCGITPYDVTHLGHAATFVWADLLASVARAVEVPPVTCRNVTDVDDVLTAAARERHRPYDDVAVTQEFLFDRDMRDLAVARPDATPRARAHVTQVVQLADALLRLDHAYEAGGTVFFRAPADLDRAGLDEQEALAALGDFGDHAEDGRQQPWDVPLWRPSDDEQPAWPSPWGWGRPAWHVECSAMAMSVFGTGVDVLVGGADLVFPHHAYQAAMVEAATGVQPFARRQMHVGTVHVAGAKMAKSTGNLVHVRDLLADHEGAAIRLLLLHRRWDEPWDYDPGQLAEATALLDRLRAAAGRPASGGREAVLTALLDDLDVPQAVGVAEERGGEAARTLLSVLRLSA
ncbi:cysteine--tRNA ligase [Nocardioides coralli]|uniref:cysteine--tRNA ligase n=1 Tax=Nocardioides coralli TaxID=2872154 RepID=UPI001CA3DD9A|nr:cysteine--tRNA ligase [Nocardioides coralli]QZY30000.1 cysteine--tRNA ligase [Nocardioides coralli]